MWFKKRAAKVNQLENSIKSNETYIGNVEKQVTILGDRLALSESIVRNVPEPLLVVERNLVVNYINPSACELFGYPQEEVTQKMKVTDILSPFGIKKDDLPLIRCIETGRTETNIKLSFKNKEGKTLIFAVSAAPLKTSTGEIRGGFMIMRDISLEEEVYKKEAEQRRYLERQVDKISAALNQIAQGNLLIELQAERPDELGRLIENIKKMAKDLRDLITNVRKSATEIASASDGLAQVVQQSVQNISQISSTIAQISSSISQTSQNAQNIANLTDETNRSVHEGKNSVENMLKKMDLVRSSAELSIKSMQGLAKRSSEINDMLTLITKIADQTNLLSLNAAIEAARAGEAGRGFAVVAEEVRKLAESSTQQSQVISQIIHQILSDIQNTQTTVNEETKEIEEGAILINQIYTMIKGISLSTEKVSQQTQQVASTSEEIAAGSQEVSASTEEQTSAIEEVSASATELARTAKILKEATEKFKT